MPEPVDEPTPRLIVAAGLVWLGERLLVQRRPPTAKHGGGLLELPGGKLERGEGPREALARELLEEWGEHAHELRVGPVAEVLHHVYPPPGPEVLLIVLHVDGSAWAGPDERWRERVRVDPGVELWCSRAAELPVEQFLAADRPFIEALRRGEIGPHRLAIVQP